MLNIEHGVFTMLYNCIDNEAKESCHNSKLSVFETLAVYIQEFTGFSNLVLDNFASIFHYYFLFCSLVFVAFCMHHLVKFIKTTYIVVFVKYRWLQVKQFLLEAKITLSVLKHLKRYSIKKHGHKQCQTRTYRIFHRSKSKTFKSYYQPYNYSVTQYAIGKNIQRVVYRKPRRIGLSRESFKIWN